MDYWFTSDNHFFHKNIIKLQPNSRKAESLEELTELQIEKWNSQVGKYDIVNCLGDFSFAGPQKTIEVLERLNGVKHLVIGNHDHWITPMSASYWASVNDYKTLKLDKKHIVMFHYPIVSFDKMHYGSFHLHGHTHGRYQHPGKAMDVGIDTRTDLGLYSWDEIRERLDK